MAKEINMASVLSGRHATYGMLARLYRREVDQDYLDKLMSMRCPINTGNTDVDKGYKLFHRALCGVWERTLEDLSRDYLRTFIGANTTGHAAAYPNESVHTSPDRLLMQDARDEVLAIYRAAGLRSNVDWKLGEDHIAVELEYMQVMSKRAMSAHAKGDSEQLAGLLMSQYHFIVDHLACWVPFLTEDILSFAKTDFYRGLAHLTKGFLEEDQAFLESVLEEELEAERAARGEDEPDEEPDGETPGSERGAAPASNPAAMSADAPAAEPEACGVSV